MNQSSWGTSSSKSYFLDIKVSAFFSTVIPLFFLLWLLPTHFLPSWDTWSTAELCYLVWVSRALTSVIKQTGSRLNQHACVEAAVWMWPRSRAGPSRTIFSPGDAQANCPPRPNHFQALQLTNDWRGGQTPTNLMLKRCQHQWGCQSAAWTRQINTISFPLYAIRRSVSWSGSRVQFAVCSVLIEYVFPAAASLMWCQLAQQVTLGSLSLFHPCFWCLS